MKRLRADLRRTLNEVFGLHSLRPGQDRVIESVLDGRSTLAVMPTGSGKSLCYQLPALLLPGMTVVVSPLIALMKDQYDKMQALGVSASQVNSAVAAGEQDAHMDLITSAKAEFVFTTPEQLANRDFLGELAEKRIDLLVIDEAHCISQWGHDFRPAYLGLRDVARALRNPPILALTATATPAVVDDIREQLGVPELNVIHAGVYRPNLDLSVVPVDNDEQKDRELIRLVSSQAGSAIVYTATVAHANALEPLLKSAGKRVARYHGRVAARERHDIQNGFMSGDLDTIVATNAFGMGVDKADIRLVVHYDLPGSLDAYYQEAGRAGRDFERADCVLLFRRQDRAVHNFLMAGRYPGLDQFVSVLQALEETNGGSTLADIQKTAAGVPKSKVRVILTALKDVGIAAERRGSTWTLKRAVSSDETAAIARQYGERSEDDRRKLERMVMYGQTALCRWATILEYFHADGTERCGHCDNCTGTAVTAVSAAAGVETAGNAIAGR